MIVLNSPARGSSFLTVFVLAALSAACTGNSRVDTSRSAAAADPASVEAIRNGGKKMPPMRAPGEEAAPVQGSAEVPPQLLAIFQDDLARRALVKHDAVTVVSATEQQWPDGAMGCPQPGQMYTQMIVPGYRVVLQASGNRYAYHSDRRGNFIVCSNGLAFKPVREQVKGELAR
ncbi:hypothetical protein [Peristeroidobacter agariperforans]|uniref:hypothetical protein n=1 Tax=Peristeroidobacter agariperforans TaxID=268404 RepID=UPI00101C5F7E|nr:hypothetical protein [Peristeroidobacter agariperforans]